MQRWIKNQPTIVRLLCDYYQPSFDSTSFSFIPCVQRVGDVVDPLPQLGTTNGANMNIDLHTNLL